MEKKTDETKPVPRLEADYNSKSCYLLLQEGEPAEQIEVTIPEAVTKKRIIVDLDKAGEILGIEVIFLK